MAIAESDNDLVALFKEATLVLVAKLETRRVVFWIVLGIWLGLLMELEGKHLHAPAIDGLLLELLAVGEGLGGGSSVSLAHEDAEDGELEGRDGSLGLRDAMWYAKGGERGDGAEGD